MKLFFQYVAILFIILSTSSHLHPLQGENCDSDSRLVADEDDNGKLRLEEVNLRPNICKFWCLITHFISNNSDLAS